MNKKQNKIKGNLGEELALSYITNLDYQIIERNFNSNFGEIDIIALDKNEIVFIEVKTRCQNIFGNPAEAIDYKKKKHIYKTATYYLFLHNSLNKNIRFDSIEIQYQTQNHYKIKHRKNIILDSPEKWRNAY